MKCNKTVEAFAVMFSVGLQPEAMQKYVVFSIACQKGFNIFTPFSGQGRIDGAFCHYTQDEKMEFLQRTHDAGVHNIEMESVCFAAMCKRAGVPAAILCVTLVDRLKGDQITLLKEQKEDFEMRPAKLVAKFIKKSLEQHNGEMCSLSLKRKYRKLFINDYIGRILLLMLARCINTF